MLNGGNILVETGKLCHLLKVFGMSEWWHTASNVSALPNPFPRVMQFTSVFNQPSPSVTRFVNDF